MTSRNFGSFLISPPPIVMLFSLRLYYCRHKILLPKALTSFMNDPLSQGSQARGPPDAYVRPANISKMNIIINFEQN
jgi:hypothetical protein